MDSSRESLGVVMHTLPRDLRRNFSGDLPHRPSPARDLGDHGPVHVRWRESPAPGPGVDSAPRRPRPASTSKRPDHAPVCRRRPNRPLEADQEPDASVAVKRTQPSASRWVGHIFIVHLWDTPPGVAAVKVFEGQCR